MKMADSTLARINRQINAFNIHQKELIVNLHLGTPTSASVELLDIKKRRLFWTQVQQVPQLCRLLNYIVYRDK